MSDFVPLQRARKVIVEGIEINDINIISLQNDQQVDDSIMNAVCAVLQKLYGGSSKKIANVHCLRVYRDYDDNQLHFTGIPEYREELFSPVPPLNEIFFPIFGFAHWILLHLDFTLKEVTLVDSKEVTEEREVEWLEPMALELIEILKTKYPSSTDFSFCVNEAAARQGSNSEDCGIFVLKQIQSKLETGYWCDSFSVQQITQSRKYWTQYFENLMTPNTTLNLPQQPPSYEIPTAPPQSPPPIFFNLTPSTNGRTSAKRNPRKSRGGSGLSPIKKKPRHDRRIDCDKCGVNLLEHNLSRHMQKHCKNRTNSPSSTNEQSTSSQSENVSTQTTLLELVKEFKELRVAITTKLSFSPPSEEQEKLKIISSLRDVHEIVSIRDELQLHYTHTNPDPDGIACVVCTLSHHEKTAKHIGVVKYDFTLGTSFDEGAALPAQFRSLRQHIVNHLSSNTHLRKLEVKEKVALELKKNEEAGICLGLSAYFSIIVGKNHKIYEKLIQLDSLKKHQVGELNHSRKFVSKMVPHIYDNLRKSILTKLSTVLKGTGRPTSLSMICDKYTLFHRPHGLIGVNMYLDGKIKTLFLSAQIIRDHTAVGYSQLFLQAARTHFDSDWEERLISICTDGAILQLNFKTHFNLAIQSDVNAHEYISYHWDYAHLHELGQKDAKEKTASRWVVDLEAKMTLIMNDIGHGKAYVELEGMGTGFRTPRPFSKTRWASYAVQVYNGFRQNYARIYDFYNDSGSDKLDTINNVPFIVQFTALNDIFSQSSAFSKTLQLNDLFSWEKDKVVAKFLNTLDNMAMMLEPPISIQNLGIYKGEDGTPLWQHLTAAWEEVDVPDTPSYKSKPLLNYEHFVQSTRSQTTDETQADSTRTSLDAAATRIKQFLSDLKRCVKNRFNKCKLEICTQEGVLFSLEKIMNQSNVVGLEEFKQYLDKARNARHFTNDDNDIYQQYGRFFLLAKKYLHLVGYGSKNSKQQRDLEKVFYQKCVYGIIGYSDNIKDIVYLASEATLRLGNECQIEAIGSKMKMQSTQRGSLRPNTLEKEVYIGWNGPPLSIEAKELVLAALKDRFGSNVKLWKFFRKSRRRLKSWFISKVVDRLNKSTGRVSIGEWEELEEEILCDQMLDEDETDMDEETDLDYETDFNSENELAGDDLDLNSEIDLYSNSDSDLDESIFENDDEF